MFFPLNDENPRERFPFVTLVLIAANVLVWMMGLPLGEAQQASLVQTWALVPNRLSSGDGGAIPTLFTSMFLHGGLMHLAGNMWFLWLFGDNLEEVLGPLLFPIFYILAGLGGGLAHVASDPHSTLPCVGASGAISGVLAGYVVLYPQAQIRVLVFLIRFARVVPIPAFAFIGIWAFFQVLMAALSSGAGGVAFMAHVGGFLSGLVLIVLLKAAGLAKAE